MLCQNMTSQTIYSEEVDKFYFYMILYRYRVELGDKIRLNTSFLGSLEHFVEFSTFFYTFKKYTYKMPYMND